MISFLEVPFRDAIVALVPDDGERINVHQS